MLGTFVTLVKKILQVHIITGKRLPQANYALPVGMFLLMKNGQLQKIILLPMAITMMAQQQEINLPNRQHQLLVGHHHFLKELWEIMTILRKGMQLALQLYRLDGYLVLVFFMINQFTELFFGHLLYQNILVIMALLLGLQTMIVFKFIRIQQL